jgi:UDP-glucose 4-epimerase
LKILVTGGAGYIASVVAADFTGTGDPPVLVATLRRSRKNYTAQVLELGRHHWQCMVVSDSNIRKATGG